MAKELNPEDFKSYEEYVNAYEKARLEEVERIAKLPNDEVVEEKEKEAAKNREEYSKYVNDFFRDKIEAEGVNANAETVKISKEEAYSGEPQTNLGRKAAEDKKNAAPARAGAKASDKG